ncbi:MAG: hypothetical protein FJ386_07170 [Verrucomicrobia bacterium]|nr:hypothetical protein [Verrucomicrobiota bacterium]
MQTPSAILPAEAAAQRRAAASAVPWHCVIVVLGAACIPIGVLWDISWHSTVGRDTFWTAAHIMIQLGGIVPGLACGWLAFKTTFFGTAEERASSVRIFGAHAPLGAWATIWGALAMVTSAPFDDWWHNAYGLDVQIISPPHSLLAVGMFGVALGCLLLVLAWQNRSEGAQRARLALLFTLMTGVMISMNAVFITEESFPNQHRGLVFYIAATLQFLPLVVLVSRASSLRWPATVAALTYMGILCGMIWVLPLFAATPKLAPVYRQVTHMVPPAFPILLVIPALAIDLVMRFWPASLRRDLGSSLLRPFATDWWKEWVLAAALGAVFLGVLLAVQWPFAAFLMSDAADNWFFARDGKWPYFVPQGSWTNEFWKRGTVPVTPARLLLAFGVAVLAARWGLWLGHWMVRVRR